MFRRSSRVLALATVASTVVIGANSPASAQVGLINDQILPIPTTVPGDTAPVSMRFAVVNSLGLVVPALSVFLPPITADAGYIWNAPAGFTLNSVTCPTGPGFSGPIYSPAPPPNATTARCSSTTVLATWPTTMPAVINIPTGAAPGTYHGTTVANGTGLLGIPLLPNTGTYSVNVISSP